MKTIGYIDRADGNKMINALEWTQAESKVIASLPSKDFNTPSQWRSKQAKQAHAIKRYWENLNQ